MAECKSCGASIMWQRTQKGRMMPLDVKANPLGNVVREFDEAQGVWLARVLTADEMETPPMGGEVRFTSHFATCPKADEHRQHKPDTPEPEAEPDARLRCDTCGAIVGDRDEHALYLVEGWAHYRAKGTNHLVHEQRRGPVKCAKCAALFKAGVSPDQRTLLDDA